MAWFYTIIKYLLLYSLYAFIILLALFILLVVTVNAWRQGYFDLPPRWRFYLISKGYMKSGTKCSRLFDSIQANALILGLDFAGKSTLQGKYLSQTFHGFDIFHHMFGIGKREYT
jgi:hypothetical protein